MNSPRFICMLAAMFMLFLLMGMTTISFATSPAMPEICPRGQQCGWMYGWTFYDSPSNGGTIDGYLSGASFSYSCTKSANMQVSADPNLGYVFESWSVSGGSLSSTTSAESTLTVPCPGSVTLTANYLPYPNVTDADAYYSSNGTPQPINKSYSGFTIGSHLSLSGFVNSTYLDNGQGANFTVSTGTVNGTDFVIIFYFQENGNYLGECTSDGKYCVGNFEGNSSATVVIFKNHSATNSYYNGSISASFSPPTGSTQLNDLGKFAVLYSPSFYSWLGAFSSNLETLGGAYITSGDQATPNNLTMITLGEYYWDIGAVISSFQQDMSGGSQQNQIISNYVIVRSTAVFQSLQRQWACGAAILETVAINVVLGVATGGAYQNAVLAVSLSSATAAQVGIVIAGSSLGAVADVFDFTDIALHCFQGNQ